MTRRYFDNTRLKDFKSCPRKYYFRHVRHWKPEGIALPLVFGLSWHEAMDVIWTHANTSKSDRALHELAIIAFADQWREEGLNPDLTLDQQDQFAPRTPGIASEMLWQYIQIRRPMIERCKLHEVEKPFAVPIGEDDFYYIGRMDKIFEKDPGELIVGEHKTTTLYKKGGPFRTDFIEMWSPNSQIDGYLHAGHMLYGDKMRFVYIDAALVHKQIHDGFKFIPVSRKTELLDAWLDEVNYWIDSVVRETKWLEDMRADGNIEQENYLPMFPKNTESCFEYMRRCPYADVCSMQPNPERMHEPPPGMVVDKWQPFEVLKIDKLGMEPEKDE